MNSPSGTDAPVNLPRASQQDGTYPRPQLLRDHWTDLSGPWNFAHDDDDLGVDAGWPADPRFDRTITVPFPPESRASGIGDRGFHPVVWYHREVTPAELAAARQGDDSPRILLHFGAVDYRAQVWLDGMFLGGHEGGHTPFSFDITNLVADGSDSHSLVVRAEDDPLDVAQPRGKQDWHPEPHDIWYDRTTGIWQTVWLEGVPDEHIAQLQWTTDLPGATVTLAVRLNRRVREATTVTVAISYDGTELVSASATTTTDHATLTVALPGQANGQAYEHLLWSPERPRLLDAQVSLSSGDAVSSYLGLRSAAVEHRAFLLNDRPYYVRSVLNQGFWPESHLAAPSVDALRAEAQLIKDLGFNAARVHQKIEDPRFLFWADKLGLLIWEEMPSVFEFSPTAVQRVTTEWAEAIERDRSHPSIVTWVPINESWGAQHIAHNPAMRAYASGLANLTRALDPTRPVITNDGWEHVDSDIWSVHDYEGSADVVQPRYADAAAVTALLVGIGPAGRRIRVSDEPDAGQPIMLTEFGGIRYTPRDEVAGAWGYTSAASADDYRDRLGSLVGAIRASSGLAGFCYTQLTDTQQEANGLYDENRVAKLPVEEFRHIFG
ncbi:MAG TPA: glycoside hydrolase family 2 TIM barrel-domain containing protein [Galbitalea sp.]|jgi:beta-galactosidase/beta-glucuronidase